jgi:hypothetical protein
MPSGTGAVSLRNLPTTSYRIDPQEFFSLTEKNVFSPGNFDLPQYAQQTTRQLLQVGVVAKLQLLIKGQAQVTASVGNTVTPTYRWPYGLIGNVQVSGNGVNNFVNCTGYDLHARKLIQYRALQDNYTSTGGLNSGTTYAANNNYTFQIALEIPLAMDDSTLVGSLYAQSEATNLTVALTTETLANLFNVTGTGTVAITNAAGTANTNPTVSLLETFFEVPYDPKSAGTLVIPDLSVLHGIIANNNPLAGLSTVTTEMYRINGQMERLIFYTDNIATGAAPNPALTSTANYSRIRLVYGGAQTPHDYNPPDQLRILNNEYYRVALPDGLFALDFVAENPARDQILLEGITNLRILTDYPASFVPGAGSKVHFVQETLFA